MRVYAPQPRKTVGAAPRQWQGCVTPRRHIHPIKCVASEPVAAPMQQTTGLKKLRLILLRHADSQQNNNVRDHERPITQQGRDAACKVAALLQARGWLPELVICSNARRTRQTLEAMQKAVEDFAAPQHKYFASLYAVAALDGQTKRHIAECIVGAAADSVACVMCVGHNKGWEEAATALAGVPVRLTTASAALLETDQATWQDAFEESTKWRLVDVVVPS